MQRAAREEVEIREPERCSDRDAEQGGDDHPRTEAGGARPEAERDERLPERDDHDQRVSLGEVRRVDAPAAHPTDERPEHPGRERQHPEHRPEPGGHERRSEDQRRADHARASEPTDRRQQIRVPLCDHREQRDVHGEHDRQRRAEDGPVTAERLGNGERGDEHRLDRVRQPRVRRPRPPQDREDEQAAPEAVPRRIVEEERRHLREREDEHQVEEQLDGGDAVFLFDTKLAHRATLADPSAPLRANMSVCS